jgi:hypothetical protein
VPGPSLRHPLDGLVEALRFRLPPLRLSNPLRILTLATWAESRERLRRQFVLLQRRALLRRNAHALLRRLRLALNRRNCGVVVEDVLWICSDMWQPYLDVIREKCSQALHILDRFHIVAKMNQALDDVRAATARKMAQDGHQPLRKKTRWCVLKRKENLTSRQKFRLRDLLRYNLQTVRAYLQREFSAVLGIQLTHLGWPASGFLVPGNDAIAHRADEEDRPHVAHSPRAAAQLFQGQKTDFQRCGRRAEQQSQNNHEKILWLSHPSHPGSCALSLTWQTT